MEFDLEDPFSALCNPHELEEDEPPMGDDEGDDDASHSISALFSAESNQSSPCQNSDLDLSLRCEAASYILQAQFSGNLDPFVAYLAINYVDRFLSRQLIPKGKPWILRLLSIACLSLASKMNKARLPISDLLGGEEEAFVYDPHTVRRMELLVLSGLGWRMRSVTPFSFLRYLLAFFRPKDTPLLAALKSRATIIIFKAQTETKLLRYKPSIVAASSLLTAAHELFPMQLPSFRNSISSSSYLNREDLRECCVSMGEAMELEVISSCETPLTVLDYRRRHHRNCSSGSESDAATAIVRSDAGGGLKKRRIGGVHGCNPV